MTGSVLIVDDDAGVTQTFAQMLTIEGHHVRTANNAEDALRETELVDLDAIILDLRMPFINGLGFLYRLRTRERHRSTPVVIVTGDYSLDESTFAELHNLGAEVRFKPLWLEELVDLARTLVSASPRDQQAPAHVS